MNQSHMINISSLDLNLLKLFAYMYKTRSVTVTAEELNISQSACSHALQRLRERLSDDLFVRVDNKMLPTEFSIRLAETVLPALNMLEIGLSSPHSFSADHQHTFTIAVTDYSTWCLKPFINFLSKNYPNLNIDFKQLDERLPIESIKQGNLDFICAFTDQHESTESLISIPWFEDEYVCLHANSHLIDEEFTLKSYLASKHILVTPWNEKRGVVDQALSKLRKKRLIVIKTASLLAAPYFVGDTEYLLTIPKKYADHMVDLLALKYKKLPFNMPNYKLLFYWHKTRSNDPKINWFIEQFSIFYGLKVNGK